MTVVSAASVEPLDVLDDRVRILLRSADSPRRVAAMHVDVPAGGGVPPHSHAVEEECYFMLDGRLDLTIDGRAATLTAGDFAHVPPGAVHAYRNTGPEPARFVAWTVGGPIDEFFAAVSRDVRRMPDDAPVMAALMHRYGILLPEAAPTGP